jgi:hypothetical protein
VLSHDIERLLNHRLYVISYKTQSIVTDLAEVYNLAILLPEMPQMRSKTHENQSLLPNPFPAVVI